MDSATEVIIPSTESWQSTQELTAEQLDRMKAETSRIVADDEALGQEYWSLDSLKVEDDLRKDGLRTLIRILNQLHSIEFDEDDDSHFWLNLQRETSSDSASDADPGSACKVLGVKQTARDINFRVRIPGERGELPLWFSLYYDPVSDYQFIKNDCHRPFTLVSLSPQGPDTEAQRPAPPSEIFPRAHSMVRPGSWQILVDNRPTVDFRILPKLQMVCYGDKYPEADKHVQSQCPGNTVPVASALSSAPLRSTGPEKRTFDDFSRGTVVLVKDTKKPRLNQDAVEISWPLQDPVTFMLNSTATPPCKELVLYKNPLSNIPINTVVHVGEPQKGEYKLMRRDKVIHNSTLSNVFKADYTRKPEYILVKILKTIEQGDPESLSYGKYVISQADSWLRELKIQSRLKHKSIVSLIGGDARFLALYMEPVEAEDLSRAPRWRDRQSGMFRGTAADAHRIFSGIISALQHIHSKGLVHNDIKPSNILYSDKTGVMLCDFGLASETSARPNVGGTPWYVPIEFINEGRRGAPGDVWAFGIVMLYVLRKMPMPGYMRSHFPEWQICQVNSPSSERTPESSAARSMRDWIAYVHTTMGSLSPKDTLEATVSLMLRDNYQQRPSSDKLATMWEKRVKSSQRSQSH